MTEVETGAAPIRAGTDPPASPVAPAGRTSAVSLKAISCPSCGGAAGSLTPGDVRDCRYCGVPLTLVAPGVAGSGYVEPAIGADEARRRVQTFLSTPGAVEELPRRAARRGIDLLFVPFLDVVLIQAGEEKTALRCRLSVTRLTACALEDDGRDVGADRVVAEKIRTRASSIDLALLAGRGVVLDPQKTAESLRLSPAFSLPILIERRTRIVYYPIWLARYSCGRSLYQVALDGVTGEVLRGIIPAGPRKRVLQGVGFTIVFSVLIALAASQPQMVFLLLRHLADFGALAAGGLVLLLAGAWDRLRFRREIIVEGGSRREQAINRPDATFLEKLASFLFQLTRRGRGGLLPEWRR